MSDCGKRVQSLLKSSTSDGRDAINRVSTLLGALFETATEAMTGSDERSPDLKTRLRTAFVAMPSSRSIVFPAARQSVSNRKAVKCRLADSRRTAKGDICNAAASHQC